MLRCFDELIHARLHFVVRDGGGSILLFYLGFAQLAHGALVMQMLVISVAIDDDERGGAVFRHDDGLARLASEVLDIVQTSAQIADGPDLGQKRLA